jgi:hypothetical protein
MAVAGLGAVAVVSQAGCAETSDPSSTAACAINKAASGMGDKHPSIEGLVSKKTERSREGIERKVYVVEANHKQQYINEGGKVRFKTSEALKIQPGATYRVTFGEVSDDCMVLNPTVQEASQPKP